MSVNRYDVNGSSSVFEDVNGSLVEYEDYLTLLDELEGVKYERDNLQRVNSELFEKLIITEKHIAELEAREITMPDGYVMVPINPSMAQEYAGYKTLTDTGKMSRLMKTRLANIYRAMITAAVGIKG